jgi:hypothetical protein
MYGAHGGSGLSAMGGSIRKGELMPNTGAIAHALKLELWAHRLARDSLVPLPAIVSCYYSNAAPLRYYWWNWSSQE